MEKRPAWKKYMDESHPESELASIYRKLRHAFNREGWSQKDLEKPPYYNKDIMGNLQRFSSLHSKLFQELKSFFPDIDHNEFVHYLRGKLQIIDSETPLQNGSKKRRDNRDEDY